MGFGCGSLFNNKNHDDNCGGDSNATTILVMMRTIVPNDCDGINDSRIYIRIVKYSEKRVLPIGCDITSRYRGA